MRTRPLTLAGSGTFLRSRAIALAGSGALTRGHALAFAGSGAFTRGHALALAGFGAFTRGHALAFARCGAFTRGHALPFTGALSFTRGHALPFTGALAFASSRRFAIALTFPGTRSLTQTGIVGTGQEFPLALLPAQRVDVPRFHTLAGALGDALSGACTGSGPIARPGPIARAITGSHCGAITGADPVIVSVTDDLVVSVTDDLVMPVADDNVVSVADDNVVSVANDAIVPATDDAIVSTDHTVMATVDNDAIVSPDHAVVAAVDDNAVVSADDVSALTDDNSIRPGDVDPLHRRNGNDWGRYQDPIRNGSLDDRRPRGEEGVCPHHRGRDGPDGKQGLAMPQPVQIEPGGAGPSRFALEDQQGAVFLVAPELTDLLAPLVDHAELVHLPFGERRIEVEL